MQEVTCSLTHASICVSLVLQSVCVKALGPRALRDKGIIPVFYCKYLPLLIKVKRPLWYSGTLWHEEDSSKLVWVPQGHGERYEQLANITITWAWGKHTCYCGKCFHV